MTDLVRIAAAVADLPSIEETDAMLVELRRMPGDPAVAALIDDLLEFRSLLAAAAGATGPR
jgi:hypothetical protein